CDRPDIRLVAGGENQRGLLADELRQPAIQLQVQFQRPIEEARPGYTRPIMLNSLYRCLSYTWVSGQPQIIVRANHHDFFSLEDSGCPLGVTQGAKVGINTYAVGFLCALDERIRPYL